MKLNPVLPVIILIIFTLSLSASPWPSEVEEVKIPENSSVSVDGDLTSGKLITDLSWASSSSVACFPATQNESFRGKHVFYGTYIPPYSIMKITVIPEPGMDISLYAYTTSTKDFNRLPPKLYSCGGCEASYNNGKPNPGKEESVEINAIRNPYNVVIGVAGPKGITSGKYKLKIDLKTKAKEPEVKGELNVTEIKNEGKEVQVKGNLKNGQLMPVEWANSSQTACFPATQNENFRGNHVFYRTPLPAYSMIEITAVPENADVDVNLYAYRVAATDYKTMPPDVRTGACEASFSYQGLNPGKEEKVTFYSARNPYNIVIAVAGPKGVTTGAYTLKINVTSRK